MFIYRAFKRKEQSVLLPSIEEGDDDNYDDHDDSKIPYCTTIST
jgi:hypothetical protein